VSNEVLRLDNQLCFPLYACARLVTQAYRAHLEPLGLTYPQYLVLLVLWERDGQKVSEIGEQLFLDSGTLTPVLKRLEHDGLISRHRPRDDERAVESRLTVAGRKLKRRAAKVPLALLCEVGLDLQQTARIRKTVRGLIPRLQRAAQR
jgi:MarR family transcriptional regulator, organic hydroperoxide resistance regulator